jgi:hypothetical protein
MVAIAGCTPEQIVTLQQLRGPIAEADQATLVAMPDAPIRVDNQILQLDGTLTPVPEDMLTARERFDLAVSRTSWATRPDMHRWLWCVIGRETGQTYFPRAFNGRGNDLSYGWMQINMRGSLGPARMASFGLSSYEDLFIPEVNLEAGFALFEAAGTAPWASTRRGC